MFHFLKENNLDNFSSFGQDQILSTNSFTLLSLSFSYEVSITHPNGRNNFDEIPAVVMEILILIIVIFAVQNKEQSKTLIHHERRLDNVKN